MPDVGGLSRFVATRDMLRRLRRRSAGAAGEAQAGWPLPARRVPLRSRTSGTERQPRPGGVGGQAVLDEGAQRAPEALAVQDAEQRVRAATSCETIAPPAAPTPSPSLAPSRPAAPQERALLQDARKVDPPVVVVA